MTAQQIRGNDRKPAGFRRSLRSSIGVLAIGVPAAFGLAACGSSNNASNTTVKAPATTVKRSLNASHAGTTHELDMLCAKLSTATHDFSHLNLSSPTSASSSSAALNTDFNKLQRALNSVSNAGEKKAGPVQSMETQARAALKEAKMSFAQLTKGNAGAAKSDFKTAVNDLESAKNYGKKANIHTCL